jgi:hypothetical protein
MEEKNCGSGGSGGGAARRARRRPATRVTEEADALVAAAAEAPELDASVGVAAAAAGAASVGAAVVVPLAGPELAASAAGGGTSVANARCSCHLAECVDEASVPRVLVVARRTRAPRTRMTVSKTRPPEFSWRRRVSAGPGSAPNLCLAIDAGGHCAPLDITLTSARILFFRRPPPSLQQPLSLCAPSLISLLPLARLVSLIIHLPNRCRALSAWLFLDTKTVLSAASPSYHPLPMPLSRKLQSRNSGMSPTLDQCAPS